MGASLKKKNKKKQGKPANCTTWEKEHWIQTALLKANESSFEEKYTYTKQIMTPVQLMCDFLIRASIFFAFLPPFSASADRKHRQRKNGESQENKV